MSALVIETAGPAMSVQDAGRAGALGLGVARGGAADRLAYMVGLALLGLPFGTAAVEMAGIGGTFRFDAPARFALTGAGMRATLDGAAIEGAAVHLADAGSVLKVGAFEAGVYGYLHVAGGIDSAVDFGGRGFHRIAGFGRALADGDRLPLGPDPTPEAAPLRLDVPPARGPIRVMPGPQTGLFSTEVRAAFEATSFVRSQRANRQGVRLDHEGEAFSTAGQLNQVSDFISEGDIQMTGDGTPFVLLADCQTIGGYPRIGTVLPVDLPRVAQAVAGEVLQFAFVTLEEAEAAWASDEAVLAGLKKRCVPRVRDPREMADLLSYELIDRPGDEVRGE